MTLNTGVDAKDYQSMAQKSDIKHMNTSMNKVTDLMDQIKNKLKFIIRGEELKMM